MKFVSIATLALTTSVNAWWGKGHLLVARIANDLLKENSPDTLTQCESVLSILEQANPSWTKKEGKHSFVECTTFADDIKHNGGNYQQGWHFIDQPYLDEGGKVSDFNFTYDSHNVTEALGALTNWFNKKGDYQHTYEYTNVMSNGPVKHTEQNGLSIALRLMIHYTGDIHQPLHGSTRLDKEYPEGDRGGNSFPLPAKGDASNLHAVWDSVIYQYTGYETLPYDEARWT